ncbi:hypothetical protein BEWA_027140 [Theileria equi strain WA]|uniref:Anti-silencing protein n=1 Tax=Theileria equi strain WA TaxID=1537102 RepID=L0AWE1_THEEQ|nr:hypothetical protein BEWA_027140 [Theileria equi strain WA]AFZ79865.1 hypothetical protein BEWA_027140 [Theileria equi strain WA]|eukprot:XP_004829531.1 hypothetical protein BEWA_027140 [Theileria equi strain WA]
MNPNCILGMQAVLITASYCEQEFIRIGYYTNNTYDDETLRENPPDEPNFDKMVRCIIDQPRVTRFPIRWDSDDLVDDEGNNLSCLINDAESTDEEDESRHSEDDEDEKKDEGDEKSESSATVNVTQGPSGNVASASCSIEGTCQLQKPSESDIELPKIPDEEKTAEKDGIKDHTQIEPVENDESNKRKLDDSEISTKYESCSTENVKRVIDSDKFATMATCTSISDVTTLL